MPAASAASEAMSGNICAGFLVSDFIAFHSSIAIYKACLQATDLQDNYNFMHETILNHSRPNLTVAFRACLPAPRGEPLPLPLSVFLSLPLQSTLPLLITGNTQAHSIIIAYFNMVYTIIKGTILVLDLTFPFPFLL